MMTMPVLPLSLSAPQGLKVAVIEGHDIGGTCVNRGCVPSKALLAASGRVRDLKNAMHLQSMGIQVPPPLLLPVLVPGRPWCALAAAPGLLLRLVPTCGPLGLLSWVGCWFRVWGFRV